MATSTVLDTIFTAQPTPLSYEQLLTQMDYQVILDLPYHSETFVGWRIVIVRKGYTPTHGLILISQPILVFLRRNKIEQATRFVHERMQQFTTPNGVYELICSDSFRTERFYEGHIVEYRPFRQEAFKALKASYGWQTTKYNWMNWVGQLLHALRKRRTVRAANILACCFDGVDTDVDRWGQRIMFTHPEVLKRHKRFWLLMKQWLEPEFIPEIEELLRGYGWRI